MNQVAPLPNPAALLPNLAAQMAGPVPNPAAPLANPAAPLPNLAAPLPNPAAPLPNLAAPLPNPAAQMAAPLPNPAAQMAAPLPNPAAPLANLAAPLANLAAPLDAGNQATLIEGKDVWLSYKDLMSNTYPAKSRKVYLSAYVSLESYCKRLGVFSADLPPSEHAILNYFTHLRKDKKWASTTLWSHFSRINAVTKRSFGLNLTIYPRLTDLLKSFEEGHRVKKACVFTPQQASLLIY
jgi:hypothetical protein